MTDASSNGRGPVVVLGGTGKTGRRVAERLEARSVAVRVASRSSEPSFDWEDPTTWAPALEGASAAYISYFPDLAAPGAPEAIGALAEVALAGGTRRLVLLSGRGEEEAQRSEQVLQASGADWTVVRCSWFSQNLSEGYLLDSVLEGEVALPAGDLRDPFVDVDDIADVAVAALTEDCHVNKVYEVTGPRPLSFGEAVEEIAQASGRDVRFVSIPVDAFTSALEDQRVPADVIELLSYLFTEVLGRNVSPANGVQEALGREPRDFTEYARDAAATGVWNV